jgi:[ribosomal protein S5]-alanine N-acetyltransferase
MIRGQNITLRVVQEKDLETLFRYSSDIDNCGEFFPLWLPSDAVFKHDFHQHGFWREHWGRLVIVDQADVMLGSIWFYQAMSYFDALEIGYLLFDRGSRNKGYMTEALALLARYLFDTRKIRRLQLTVVVGNLASKRVAEKCGFISEGIARKAVFLRGQNMDLEWFSLLREEAEQQPWWQGIRGEDVP